MRGRRDGVSSPVFGKFELRGWSEPWCLEKDQDPLACRFRCHVSHLLQFEAAAHWRFQNVGLEQRSGEAVGIIKEESATFCVWRQECFQIWHINASTEQPGFFACCPGFSGN